MRGWETRIQTGNAEMDRHTVEQHRSAAAAQGLWFEARPLPEGGYYVRAAPAAQAASAAQGYSAPQGASAVAPQQGHAPAQQGYAQRGHAPAQQGYAQQGHGPQGAALARAQWGHAPQGHAPAAHAAPKSAYAAAGFLAVGAGIKHFTRTLIYEGQGSVEQIQRDLDALRAFDDSVEGKQARWGKTSAFGFVVGVISLFLIGVFPPLAVGAIGFIALGALSLIPYFRYKRVNLEDRRYELVAGLLGLIESGLIGRADELARRNAGYSGQGQ